MKKYFFVLFLIIFIIPQIALASWWNPFSWKIWRIFDQTPQAKIEQNTSSELSPVDTSSHVNGEKLDEAVEAEKKPKATNVPTKTAESPKKSTESNTQALELEKLKKEVGELKNQKVNSQSTGAVQEQPKPVTVQETPQQRENYDQELSQWIAEVKQRITVFNGAMKGANDVVPEIRGVMNKYASSQLIQSSGLDLINENNNLATISKKLIDIETQRVNRLSSYLGLGILPTVRDFSTLKIDYDDYSQKYESSIKRANSLMLTFVNNEKEVLGKILAEEKQELAELKNLLSREMVAKDAKLDALKTQIDDLNFSYDNACKEVSMAGCLGIRAEIARKLNPLIDEYNSLLGNTSGKIYSSRTQSYFTFEADQYGGGILRDQSSNSFYTFDCDQWGDCIIYGQ